MVGLYTNKLGILCVTTISCIRGFTLTTRHLFGAILWLGGQMFLWPPWRCTVSCALSGKIQVFV